MARIMHGAVAQRPASRFQQGVSLIFALLALAAISLAAVALVRSVDGGSLVIGNLGFKQETTRAADRAAEEARVWIAANTANLNGDVAGAGYYAAAPADLDPTGKLTSSARMMNVINWGDPDSCACTATSTCATCDIAPRSITLPNSTVTASYVITRLCPTTGAPSTANACSQPASNTTSATKDQGNGSYGGQVVELDSTVTPYYRIIVRTSGGRNTVSFTETMVH
jgi:type IV pilus assembly protein PilX